MNVLASDTRYGPILYPQADPFFRVAMEDYGEWSWNEVRLWQQIVAPGSVVVSAGSNIGCHVIALAQLVGKRGAIFAFEPQLPLWQLTVANCCLANVNERVRAVNAALGAEAGVIQMPAPDYNVEMSFGGLSLRHTPIAADAVRYPVIQTTIDSLKLPRCEMIQLDIEGMEAEAIDGAKETIQRCQPIVFVEAEALYPGNLVAMHKRVVSMGYKAYWHIVPFVAFPNYKGCDTVHWPDTNAPSWLCVPEGTDVSAFKLHPVEDPMRRPETRYVA